MLGCLGNFMDRRLPASFSGAPDEPTGFQPMALQVFGSGGFQPVFRERRRSASFFCGSGFDRWSQFGAVLFEVDLTAGAIWARPLQKLGSASSLVPGLYAKNQNRQAVLAHLNQHSTGITSLRHHALSLPVHRDKAMPGVLVLARLVVPRMESRGLGSRRIHKTRSLLLPFGSDNAPSDVQRRRANGES